MATHILSQRINTPETGGHPRTGGAADHLDLTHPQGDRSMGKEHGEFLEALDAVRQGAAASAAAGEAARAAEGELAEQEAQLLEKLAAGEFNPEFVRRLRAVCAVQLEGGSYFTMPFLSARRRKLALFASYQIEASAQFCIDSDDDTMVAMLLARIRKLSQAQMSALDDEGVSEDEIAAIVDQT